MSSNFWQTKKQNEQFNGGSTITEKIEKYIKVWSGRCYKDIPDEVPEKVARSFRAPSYKSIAMAILRNDHSLKSLGFSSKEPNCYREIVAAKRREESCQYDLF